jgi:cobyrinic acid a,c-diamide synthase
MAHLYLSAAHKSSGKTTISIAICSELSRLGHRVQPFKKGPDYIDPLWLCRAAGRDCLNLDFNTMSADEIRADFARCLCAADVGVIEGNVGLFDSVDLLGSQSNAELAKLLSAPVILVLDAQGMSRGVAPLLLGYRAFDPDLHIAGVVLNRVGGSRHEVNLRRVVEHYTDLPVLGAVRRDPSLQIEERHLGLMPSNEAVGSESRVERIRSVVADQLDIQRILAIARSAPKPEPVAMVDAPSAPAGPPVRIGIARDEAFGFYYPDDLWSLQAAGAELIPFSPVGDPELPQVDGLFIGGGFPEYRMRELAANRSMRDSIRDFIETGGVAYAECGGLMYLCRSLGWKGRVEAMCGVLNADVAMHERPQGRGYIRLREMETFPWPRIPGSPAEVRAHEFHHSAVVDPDPNWLYGYEVMRGSGIDGRHDAVIHNNLVAGYAHLRHVGGVAWTRRFIAHVRGAAA